MTNHNKRVGERGEDIAERHLKDHDGATIVARNWRCPHGEIDVIARVAGGRCGLADGVDPGIADPILAFVEVKTRRGLAFGDPLEAITVEKLGRLRLLVGAYLSEHPTDDAIRLDGIGVLWQPGREPQVRHLIGLESAWG